MKPQDPADIHARPSELIHRRIISRPRQVERERRVIAPNLCIFQTARVRARARAFDTLHSTSTACAATQRFYVVHRLCVNINPARVANGLLAICHNWPRDASSKLRKVRVTCIILIARESGVATRGNFIRARDFHSERIINSRPV